MISIVIVNYNGQSYIESCIDSVLGSSYKDFEIIVVENNSTDDSLNLIKKRYTNNPKVKLIISSKNRYFTGGCNLGANNAQGEYLLFLNSDCVVTNNWLDEMVKQAKSHVIIQPKILSFYDKTRIDNVGGRYVWPGLGFGIGHLEQDKGQYDGLTDIDFANGTCLMIYAQAFKSLGGFDESFKLFYEDVDLCFRARRINIACQAVPNAVIYHRGGQSIKMTLHRRASRKFSTKNRITTVSKNFTGTDRLLRMWSLKCIEMIIR